MSSAIASAPSFLLGLFTGRSWLYYFVVAILGYLGYSWYTKTGVFKPKHDDDASKGPLPARTSIVAETQSDIAGKLEKNVVPQSMVGPIATSTETEAYPVNNPAPIVPVINADQKQSNVPVLAGQST